jgi:hypothetical protein
VAFHVEIRQGIRWAREFNLDEDRLRRMVLEPWAHGSPVQMGDKEWEPADSDLRILQGPELSGSDLAFGRGWDRAERAGEDVTRGLLAGALREASAVAVLAESASARDSIVTALSGLGLKGVDWPAAAGDSGATVAVILAVEGSDPPREWLFEAGAAVGALGGRAVVVRLSRDPVPPELAGLEVVEPGSELAPALAAGLRRIGFR